MDYNIFLDSPGKVIGALIDLFSNRPVPPAPGALSHTIDFPAGVQVGFTAPEVWWLVSINGDNVRCWNDQSSLDEDQWKAALQSSQARSGGLYQGDPFFWHIWCQVLNDGLGALLNAFGQATPFSSWIDANASILNFPVELNPDNLYALETRTYNWVSCVDAGGPRTPFQQGMCIRSVSPFAPLILHKFAWTCLKVESTGTVPGLVLEPAPNDPWDTKPLAGIADVSQEEMDALNALSGRMAVDAISSVALSQWQSRPYAAVTRYPCQLPAPGTTLDACLDRLATASYSLSRKQLCIRHKGGIAVTPANYLLQLKT